MACISKTRDPLQRVSSLQFILCRDVLFIQKTLRFKTYVESFSIKMPCSLLQNLSLKLSFEEGRVEAAANTSLTIEQAMLAQC